MKKLKDLKGAKMLNKTEQQSIKGGLYKCIHGRICLIGYKCVDGYCVGMPV